MERRNLLIYVIINGITTSNASHSPRNDIENLCNTQVTDGTATLSYNDLKKLCNTQCDGWNGYVPPLPFWGGNKQALSLFQWLKFKRC